MIRKMRPDDIPDAMQLKQAAGWNQVPGDWERLLRLEPHGCFVAEIDGKVVGSATALRHGAKMAWLGMVLVLPEYRRRGIAKALTEHALAWLDRQGVQACGLDATDMGKPLYEQLGFTTTDVIERWERPQPDQSPVDPTWDSWIRLIPQFTEEIRRLDLEACGYDRSAMLSDLCIDRSGSGVTIDDGFALSRPGSEAWFVGPCVARSPACADKALQIVLAGLERERIFWDLLPSNGSARELASELGFGPARKLDRMVRRVSGSPAEDALSEQVYAAAGFEFG